MKNWNEFITKKTKQTQRNGKILNMIDFEILCLQTKLKVYEQTKEQAQSILKYPIHVRITKFNEYKAARKLIKECDFEIFRIQKYLQSYENIKQEKETEIIKNLERFYTDGTTIEQEIKQAKQNAQEWNTEPLYFHKKEKRKTNTEEQKNAPS